MNSSHNLQAKASEKHSYYEAVPNSTTDHFYDQSDELEVRDVIGAIRRRWIPLLGTTVITFAGLMAWFVVRSPSYQRQFSVAVEPLDRLVSGDSGSSLLRSLSGSGVSGLNLPSATGGTDYTSLIEVLKSEMVLAPVVQTGQEYDPEFDHEELLEKLTIEQIDDSKILEISFKASDADLVQAVTLQLQETFLEYSTETQQMALIRRLSDLNSQVELQRQEVARSQALLLEFQEDNQILDLKAASEVLETRRSEVLVEQQNTRLSLRANLEKYNNLKNQLGLSPEDAVVVANLSESPIYQKILTEYRDLESQIALESARFRENTPIVQALRDKQEQLRPLLQAEAARNIGNSLTPTSEDISQTLGYQGSVGRELISELVASVNEIQMLRVKDQSLSELYADLSGELDNLVNLGSNFREIERDLILAEEALQALLAAQQELKLDLERDTNPWLIVSGYDLGAPLKPEDELVRNIVISLIVATALGLGVTFLFEVLDRSYHDIDKLSEKLRISTLASIPLLSRHRETLKPTTLKTSNFNSLIHTVSVNQHTQAELKFGAARIPLSDQARFEDAFHNLSANLYLLSADRPVQIVAISSASAGDGKTTVASHLAVAVSRMGRKVLLIDCNLKEPMISRLFGLEQLNLLREPVISIESLIPEIRPLCEDESLSLLQLAAQGYSAPTELFSSSSFELLLKKCRSNYDLVILDTPSPLGHADTKLLSQHTDGLLCVVRMGYTNRDIVSSAVKDFCATSTIPLLGLVANGIALR